MRLSLKRKVAKKIVVHIFALLYLLYIKASLYSSAHLLDFPNGTFPPLHSFILIPKYFPVIFSSCKRQAEANESNKAEIAL